jgi:hypothetical protein
MRSLTGWILAITGVLACPCHLPLTLPFLLAVLGGTALGSILQQKTDLVVAVATAYFLAAIGLGLSLLRRGTAREDHRACCAPEQPPGPMKDRQHELLDSALKAQNWR